MKCTFIIILAISICFLDKTKSCSSWGANWNLLDGSPWNATTNGTRLYQISLCRPLNYSSGPEKNCDQSAVCLFENGTARRLVDFSSVNASILKTMHNLHLLELKSLLCPHTNWSTITIGFQCGEHLNFPIILTEDRCSLQFAWRTSAACTETPKRKEVQCYTLNKNGAIKDLSPLIKNRGGYKVLSSDIAVDFFINVCSDIIPENETNGCPPGSSACRKIGSEFLSFGSPDTILFNSGSTVKLVYNSINASVPAGCDMPPRTTVTFICPLKGRSRIPRVISNLNCQYEIEWVTEYSCPLGTLVTDIKSCRFTMEQHGVELDFTPLSKQGGGYRIMPTAGNKNISFMLNVCSGLGGSYACGNWKSSSACMIDSSGKLTTIGYIYDANLRFSDGFAELTYRSRTKCNGEINYKTVIEFQCEPDAENNGLGQPQFVEQKDCLYLFIWKTKHACPKHPLSSNCYVYADGIEINLGMLVKNPDEKPWQVMNTLERANDTYYLNICGSISKNFHNSCGAGAAVCKVDGSSLVDYGKFTSPPTYDKQFKTVHMTYKDGDSCGNGQHETHINFFCKPGMVNSPPILERISDDGCTLNIRWHTAAACPQTMKKGSNCKVIDEDLGFVFDLNPLKKDSYYEVKVDKYTYYLNVCGNVIGTPCDKTQGQSENAAACQVEGKGIAMKLGEPNSELLYIDGMISLTYQHGMPYNNEGRIPRTTLIKFVCDEAAGVGHPEFVEEAHYAYSFRWYTSYACPAKAAIECSVKDPFTNKQYDFSRLAKTEHEKNWVVSGKENETRKFYMNICRPLTSTNTHCPPLASACLVEFDKSKGSEVATNIGQMSQPPIVKSNGHVELEYTNGGPCIFYGINSTYSTTVHFLCTKGESLVYVGKQGNCHHTFLWSTSAACPIEETISKNECSISDPLTGVTYDFKHLKKKYYHVTAGTRRFQVNICGAVSEGCQASNKTSDVTACEIDEKGNLKKIIGTLNGYSLTMSEDKVVTLVYNGTYNQSTGTVSKVYITFKCNKLGNDSNLIFKQMDSHNYYFDLFSSSACIAKWDSCTFSDDSGNNYDLTPLIRRNNSNWEVNDDRFGYQDRQYHINFCVPLNPTSSYRCPDGPIGVCQTSTRNYMTEGYNLGFIKQKPEIRDGMIIIQYTGGIPCYHGKYNSSTEIILHCSEKQRDPVFVGENPGCKYIFSMHTPAACPLKDIVGKDCAVTDPEFGYHFDLSPLQQTTGRHQVRDGEYEYILNVCSPVIDPPPECAESGVCQTKVLDPSYAVDAGKSNSLLHYNKGLVQLKYESGKGNCHGKYNRSTIITFTCNQKSKEVAPKFLSEEEDCTYLFEWPTYLVCHKHELEECSVSSDTEHYDLSSLQLNTMNYIVVVDSNKYVLINICRRLSSTSFTKNCSHNSAACIIEYDENIVAASTSIGQSGTPYLENGELKLKYTFGDDCEYSDAAMGNRKLQTLIEFECSEGVLHSEPRFIGVENCTWYFTWVHAAACPVKLETLPSNNCTAINPVTGFQYDLSPLRNAEFYQVMSDEHEFNINVCGPIKNSGCRMESGSCQKESSGTRSWNTGNYNSKLHFNGGTLILNYTDGDLCHGLYNRNTIIEFSCGVGDGHPSYVNESAECTYYFTWETVYACEDRVPCVVTNGSEIIDLSPLTRENGEYHLAVDLTGDSDQYIINVCSPLNHANAKCHDAGICHTSGASAVESLGHARNPPFIDFYGHVTLIYSNGSPCNNEYNNTARIMFSCDPDEGMGTPILVKKDKSLCHYVFEWKTSLVCPTNIVSLPTSNCKFSDVNRGINIDLSPLKRNSTYKVKGKLNGNFTVNVCGLSKAGESDCSSAGVCFHGMGDEENFGSLHSAEFSYDGKQLTLTYNDGGSCPLSVTGKRSSRIFFTCDERGGLGSPVLSKQSSCLAAFTWKTNLVCIEEPPECTFRKNNKFYDLRLLSSITHSWSIPDSNGNVYWINVCKPTNHNFGLANCHMSGICMRDSNGSFFSLGTLYSWKLTAMDTGEIILTYEDGSDVLCPGMSAVSHIKFICGNTMSIPSFMNGPSSSCEFYFIWETAAACAETRKEFLPSNNHIIVDSRLGISYDMSALFNQTFIIEAKGLVDQYVYVINLKGVKANVSAEDCKNAAICQTKPGIFYRDIGTVSTEMFYLTGNELQLEIISHGRKCGKNENKNVTTIINFVCVSAAGLGKPTFFYESGNCDYLFEWETNLVCPVSSRKFDPHANTPKEKVDKQHVETSSSHVAQILIAVFLSSSLVAIIIFIVSKESRRTAIRRKISNALLYIPLPKICYRRTAGETLLLSAAATTPIHDESDVEILT